MTKIKDKKKVKQTILVAREQSDKYNSTFLVSVNANFIQRAFCNLHFEICTCCKQEKLTSTVFKITVKKKNGLKSNKALKTRLKQLVR